MHAAHLHGHLAFRQELSVLAILPTFVTVQMQPQETRQSSHLRWRIVHPWWAWSGPPRLPPS